MKDAGAENGGRREPAAMNDSTQLRDARAPSAERRQRARGEVRALFARAGGRTEAARVHHITVESRKGAVALRRWANGSVSLPRSSNRTCGFPASGFPTGFIVRLSAQGWDAFARA